MNGSRSFVESKKRASALTVFPAPAMPPTTYAPNPYTGHCRSFKGGRSYTREVARTEFMTDPSGYGLTTMTVTVPQDSKSGRFRAMRRPLTLNVSIEGAEAIGNSQDKGMPPPTISASCGTTTPVCGGVEAYNK